MIIAVDFDGVLCEDKFPAIGSPKTTHINFVKYLIRSGHEVILWTSRVGRELNAAINWCEDMGIVFVAVNDNAPSNKQKYAGRYANPPRKVYADLYIDDHAVGFEDTTLEYKTMEAINRKENDHDKR